jgi:secondary thiamine-phosphate synthase enzyme
MLITVKTNDKTEMVEITEKVQDAVRSGGLSDGICMVYVPHTTAAVTINENADPTVKSDILTVLNSIIPWKGGYLHQEGNSPAHIKSSLIGVSQCVGVENGRLVLGTWQGIFFCEFDGPRTRKVHIRLLHS